MAAMTAEAHAFTLPVPRLGAPTWGKVMDSRKASAPSFGFDSAAGRDAARVVFVSSKRTACEKMCREGPGPKYALPSSFSKQADSSKRTATSVALNSSTVRMKTIEKDVPGPGTYELPSSVGAQALSNKASPAAYSLSPKRVKPEKQFISAGHTSVEVKGTLGADPGSYAPKNAMGQQATSSFKTLPSFSWGSQAKMADTPKEKALQANPPVGIYEALPSIGKQPTSKFKTSPAIGFGKASTWGAEHKRFISHGHTRAEALGRGADNYDSQTSSSLTSFGRQALSTKSSPRGGSFGMDGKMKVKHNTYPGPGSYFQ